MLLQRAWSRAARFLLLDLAAAALPNPAEAVKIGVLTDMSGVVADATGTGSVVAAQLAAEDMGGTLLGQPIEIVSADDQLKPDIAGAIARRWFDLEHVDAVVDLVVTPIALSVQQLGRDKNKIVLITGAGSQALFGASCSPTSFVWTFDTALQSRTAVLAAPERGTKWFLIAPAYSYGAEIEALMRREIAAQGGVVVGSVQVAFGSSDYSSALLSAQASGAGIIAFAQAGHDASTLVLQAHEFRLAASGQRLVADMLFITDIDAIGLPSIDGLFVPTTFYWDADEASRAFSRRFSSHVGRPPTSLQAGVYSATLHYLQAVKATGTTDTATVAASMHAAPVNDATVQNGRIRSDGRLMRDMYLMQVKEPGDSHGRWDYYRIVRHIPAGELQDDMPNAGCKLN